MPQQTYSIELYFDPALENQVLKSWNILARRQISTQLIEIESRPHITLFSSPFIDPSKLEPVLNSFSSRQEPLHLTFSSIGLLPNHNNNSNNLLFLSPTPTFSLLNFQSQLIDLLRKEGVDICDDFVVESWIPACPVAQDVPKSSLGEAVNVLRELKLPVSGYGVDVGVVQFSPVREVYSFMLGHSVDGVTTDEVVATDSDQNRDIIPWSPWLVVLVPSFVVAGLCSGVSSLLLALDWKDLVWI